MQNLINRLGWIVAGVLALALVALAAGIVSGGPLDPPGAPGPTMHTLDELGPWDNLLASDDNPIDDCASSRFQCVLGATAALDRETGLVWRRSPTGATTWNGAQEVCSQIDSSNRSGWRVPTIWELETLEYSGDGATAHQFPPNDPFFGISAPKIYWSSTVYDANTANAHVGDFDESDNVILTAPKTNSHQVFCVRAP